MHLPYRGAGLYILEAGCNPARLARVTKSLVRECRRLAERPVPRAELKRVQDFLAGSYALSLESPSNRMFRLALSHIYMGRFEPPEEVLAQIAAVTPAELQAFAGELFDPTNLSIAAVVPEGTDAEVVKARLAAIAA
jgi:predicted Zn-dependent peptidase